jgi:mono/diheme cytochrome c family protein
MNHVNLNLRRSIVMSAAAAALCLGVAGACCAKSITLPPDGVELRASELPGYGMAQTQCVACHSAEYLLYQPPTAARPYWTAMVKRMKAVFKAPVEDADMPAIVDYLVKTYGNEQTR